MLFVGNIESSLLTLIGSPPSKVYGNMRAVAARSTERI